MTPERLEEIPELLHYYVRSHTPEQVDRNPLFRIAEELVLALQTERARLDTLAKLRPGELFDALHDSRGLRVVLDERIAEREKGAAR